MRLLLTLAAVLALSLPALANPFGGVKGTTKTTTTKTTTTRTATSSTRVVASAPVCTTTAANFAPPVAGPVRTVAAGVVAARPVRTVAAAALAPIRRLLGCGCGCN